MILYSNMEKPLVYIHLLDAYHRQAIATGLANLQWDSAELLQIVVKDRMSYKDAFVIEEVRQLLMIVIIL